MAYFTGLQQRGEVENVEVAIVEVHGGDLDGFILLRGDQEQLGRVRASAEFQRLLLRGGFAVEIAGVVSARPMGKPLVSRARRTASRPP